jgi:hypothetical protein
MSRGHLRRSLLLLAGLALAASGCLGTKGSPPADSPMPAQPASTSATQTTADLPPVAPPPAAASVPPQIAWNKCQGLDSSIFFYDNVVDLDGGRTPPGWEPDPTQDDRYLFMMNRCERVSIGPFERGPATFLLEVHSAVNAPKACTEFNAGFEDMEVLLGLWVDDRDLAAYLAQAFGLPAEFAEFSLQAAPQGDGQTQQWTWSAGGQESTLTAYRPGGDEGLSPYLERVVWHNETGVSFLDLHDDDVIPFTVSPPAAGVLAPPMNYAQGTARPYAGLVSVWNEGDHYGPIFRFGDMECKTLLG